MNCCFIGHRKIDDEVFVRQSIDVMVEELILCGYKNFYFGSRGRFNEICWKSVTALRDKYPHINRVYVRAEFEFVNEDYFMYLLESFEQTYFSSYAKNVGHSVYVRRNQEIIDICKLCIFYYKENSPTRGTHIALQYAKKKNKEIIIINNRLE